MMDFWLDFLHFLNVLGNAWIIRILGICYVTKKFVEKDRMDNED